MAKPLKTTVTMEVDAEVRPKDLQLSEVISLCETLQNHVDVTGVVPTYDTILVTGRVSYAGSAPDVDLNSRMDKFAEGIADGVRLWRKHFLNNPTK